MSQTRPGWRPHISRIQPGDQHLSWQHLLDTWPRSRYTSFRRFWSGSRWEGSYIANIDLLAITVCPGCQRQTGFVALSAEEEKKYVTGFILSGSRLLSNPRKIPKRLLRAWQAKDTLKCIDCSTHVTLCPSCKQYEFATIGVGTCTHCGEEYM